MGDERAFEMQTPLGPSLMWWSISGRSLLAALRRVAAGEDPEMVYAELYANSEHETVEP